MIEAQYPEHLNGGAHYYSTYYFTPISESHIAPGQLRPLHDNVSDRVIKAAKCGDELAQKWIAFSYNHQRLKRLVGPRIEPVNYDQLIIETLAAFEARIALLS